jgi:Lon protease-like protein
MGQLLQFMSELLQFMSELLPLFPLPTVVLFPGVFLPLHIFEPRYRAMIADALAGDRLIGMVLLRDGWQKNYEGRPPVFDVGCSGVITHCETTPDGRYNIILRGVERFRITEENHDRQYRRAAIDRAPERSLSREDRVRVTAERGRIEALLGPAVHSSRLDPAVTASMSDEDLIHALAQYLDLLPIEKQALLERASLLERAKGLIELLEMRVLAAKLPGVPPLAH